MKNHCKSANLPLITAGLGGVALVLRRLLYTFGVDEKNLIVTNHPLEIGLGVLTGAALVYLLLSVRKLDGSPLYEDNFQADLPCAIGHILMACGILMTVLTTNPMMENYLGTVWRWLGYLSPVCLLAAAMARAQGKQPFFALHLVPCLFLVFHIVNHYQVWSGNPQFQDYVITLFGTMALMFFGFYTTAFDAGVGRRRMQLFMGLTAGYLCMAELAATSYPFLYIGGMAWSLTGLCSLEPKPKPEEPEAQDEKKEEA